MSKSMWSPERRRTIRIKRSELLRHKLDDIDRPTIKFAETIDELRQAFSLVHDTYLKSGYLKERHANGMLYDIFPLLPDSTVIIAKSYLTVISTLTEIFDTDLFGLPMDALYRKELDALRAQDRCIVEISALVTPRQLRWRNLFMYLYQVVYQFSKYCGVNDICITVNPKHVPFYKDILLFEDLGPERHYPKVDAPAVALRIDMDSIEEKGKKTYEKLGFDTNLYEYFHRMKGVVPYGSSMEMPRERFFSIIEKDSSSTSTVRHFLQAQKSLLGELSAVQLDFLNRAYPGLGI